MATLVLQAAGAALGSAVGGPMLAAVGQAAGAALGGMIDRSLLGGSARKSVEGPRLKSLDGISATEGAPIPRVYGRVRLGAQVIWATRFEELVQSQRNGKSGGKSAGAGRSVTTSYSYFANLAVALCEGPISMVRRVWADGKPLDLTSVTMRVHLGHDSQEADPLIAARQGESPAYRGTAYVVFERLPLDAFGNRLPQLSFEVVRCVGSVNAWVRGVDLIPGASEFAYQPTPVVRSLGRGISQPENRNQLTHVSDLSASLDALQAVLPNANSVALVASWFGTDLRAGHCAVKPAVDSAEKTTIGGQWSVAGVTRENAHVVSQVEGRPAYGGTPSDASILAAIADLKARGLSVVFYPFLMMDVPPGNALLNPYDSAPGQPDFPWRGRITLDVAPGRPGSTDGTAAAATAVAAFFGTVNAGHFAVAQGSVMYSGPDEWSFRRHVLHNAALCKAAGGVDAFIIGSELIGLTRIRSAAGIYPAVSQLKMLAAEVRALLGPGVKIGYAADWTEYGAHVLAGGQEVRFPLDALWSDTNIDFVGIDFYPPVSDWRSGSAHADAQEWESGRGRDYLAAGFAAGEAFHWYYAENDAREAQNRSPITDGAYGKPWVYRAKDIRNWWLNAHIERVGGVETAATGWVPQAKPIWLTELGCPAVDKGANAPNLFPDPKSSESALPPFSTGARDDLLQTRYLEAAASRFDPEHPDFLEVNNPVSGLFAGRMVDPSRIHVWAWDARPYPAFPHLAEVWGDGANWQTGHWLNGRVEGMGLDSLIRAISEDFGTPLPRFDRCEGFLDGYLIDRTMSARGALEPLISLFGLHVAAESGAVKFCGPGAGDVATLTADDLVPDRKGQMISRNRAQETELPRRLAIGFADAEGQYQTAAISVDRPLTASRREMALETSAVLRRMEVRRLADQVLQAAWIGREMVSFTLRPGLLDLAIGDVVSFTDDGSARLYRITRIVDGLSRQCEARAIVLSGEQGAIDAEDIPVWNAPRVAGPAHAEVLDLPLDGGEPTPLAMLAIAANPWMGPYTLWRSNDGTTFDAVAMVGQQALLGETTAIFGAGPLWRWDRSNALKLRLDTGALSSVGDTGALASRSLLAVCSADSRIEVLSFATATIDTTGEWTLTGLLRGLGGSEAEAARTLATGAQVVVIDGALEPLFAGAADVGRQAMFRISPSGTDHADAATTEVDASAGLASLRPLSPVLARARRTGEGVVIEFIRRTRRDGDNWGAADVPLAEDIERYVVRILSGATVIRTIETNSVAALYPTADELADFGGPQASLSISLAQISRLAGPGQELEVTVPVRMPV